MTEIVLVHGIGQQFRGSNSLQAAWLPALHDGFAAAARARLAVTNGAMTPTLTSVSMAYYGDLFRQPGSKGILQPSPKDFDHPEEIDLLLMLWQAARDVDSAVTDPADSSKARTPLAAQRALLALSNCSVLGRAADKFVMRFVKQVGAYFQDPVLREAAMARVAERITDSTKLVIGHSLGSVVAYEHLTSRQGPPLHLISLGSPLGIPRSIVPKLATQPIQGQSLPPGIATWTNICDARDIVALQKNLSPTFGSAIRDLLCDNGRDAHSACNYLTAEVTGEAVHQAVNF